MKYLIKKYKLKQDLIANALNCSQTLVSKWCRGLCEPSLNVIIKMSEAFNIPIDEIVLAFKKEDRGLNNEEDSRTEAAW